MKALSLFANIGVSEAFLKNIGINIVLANEYVEKRAVLYSKIYPETEMICGDFTKKEIFDSIISKSNQLKIDIIMATPPCQGMSTAGQNKVDDERNKLIIQTIDLIRDISPKYVFIENVPHFLKTTIEYKKRKMLIPDLIKSRLEKDYIIEFNVVDTKDYSVPQSRKRTIVLLTRKDQRQTWSMPNKSNKHVTLKEAIGHIPIIDPFIKDIDEEELLNFFPNYYKRKKKALQISKWNNPPVHVKRQVIAMTHTPTSCSAFDNKLFKPTKVNGELVKGFKNTYKRQNWNLPAYTVTMDNRKISSQNNVHPGRYIGRNCDGHDLYTDARSLTLYEIMKIMSLPDDWPIPLGTSEAFIRSIIGEGIPPLFTKQVFEKLNNKIA
ncbi:MAG: DNA (cytosine-5)-methyltransferase 1 [Arcobacteraceae bacterium]|jgi:DNA (cytosine-5)-methyltransferase 1